MEEVVKKLSDGAYLWKIRGIGKYYNRQFKVDRDSMSVVAESKKWWSPGGLTSIPIVEIVEIREGWKTDTFNKVSEYSEKMKEKGSPVSSDPPLEESLCFSIIHGNGREVLDLMANSTEQRDLWVDGLKYLMENVQSMHQDRLYDVWLRKKFEAADKDKNGALNMDEISKLVASLNLKLDKKHAKTLFNEANKSKIKRDGEQVLDAQEFVNFYHSLLKMTEIEKVYDKYASKETKVMGVEELLDFLRTENGKTDFQSNQATQLIQEFELSSLKENDYLSFDGFYHLLLSDLFDIYNYEHRKTVYQDMTRPLSHYYISSSHNTYLTGHQLAGESSVEGYISALKRGCRVVELDVWDGDDGEPVIYHGHTLTSKITLADVLRDAIKLYAFTASPYPVILSVENHLSIEQQVVMVKLFKDILGDSLLTDPVPSGIQELPSPDDLKYKIIVKAKKPQGKEIEDDDEDDDQDNIDFIDSDDGNTTSKKVKHHKPLAPELGQVVNFCEGKKFISFGSSIESDKCIHFPSLRENKAKSLFESCPDDFVRFTERQIAKIYPHGTRTDSSNLKPYPFWSTGAQVVTLNMQTEDKANFYNDAFFKRNGNCGYVLKPDILTGRKEYNPRSPQASLSKILRIKIISGQHLPPSEKKSDIVDPYIQVKVRGHPDDKQKQRTKTIKNNGFNPVWNEILELRIKVPDVALVYFTVRDESSLAKDPVLALACIPFGSITTGYRHVHLTDINGKSLSPAALFVHVSISNGANS
ncbi:1-phosphatidylinositol 4,5-bisphosphate phosphodiesterase delta-4 [Armadillidium vulgare]|nr:1-phosphatidylinositol 4,5-bisphosphate phosphodiesterase delta-4 [Armadillidium vulgare]